MLVTAHPGLNEFNKHRKVSHDAFADRKQAHHAGQ
jgi:hypothetical protein